MFATLSKGIVDRREKCATKGFETVHTIVRFKAVRHNIPIFIVASHPVPEHAKMKGKYTTCGVLVPPRTTHTAYHPLPTAAAAAKETGQLPNLSRMTCT